jgi:hypothetical protein
MVTSWSASCGPRCVPLCRQVQSQRSRRHHQRYEHLRYLLLITEQRMVLGIPTLKSALTLMPTNFSVHPSSIFSNDCQLSAMFACCTRSGRRCNLRIWPTATFILYPASGPKHNIIVSVVVSRQIVRVHTLLIYQSLRPQRVPGIGTRQPPTRLGKAFAVGLVALRATPSILYS